MANTNQDPETIRRVVILEELQNLLSSDTDVRNAAEEKMKKLEVTEGYGVYLTELIMNKCFDLPLRQIACIMLKHYVENHWGDGDATIIAGGNTNKLCDSSFGCGDVVNEDAKRTIRNMLPNGLYDTNSKIRSSVAHAISTIAANDWPTVWTDFFDIILKCLESNEDAIHGAMQILQDDFTYDEDQIKELGPAIITQANRIFISEQTYSIKTRASVLSMLKPFLLSISVNIADKQEQLSMINLILNEMMAKLLHYLSMNSAGASNFFMRTQIVKLFTFLVTDLPHCIQPFVERILPVIWQLLTQIADIYVKVVVNQAEPSPFPVVDDADVDDDELANFSTMIVQIFEFIQTLIGASGKLQFRAAFNDVLTDLIYIVIVYIQLPEEQLDGWKEDVEKFVEDEYDGGMDLTIRIAGQDILEALDKDLGVKVLPSLQEALGRHMNVAEAEKTAGNPYWWKIQEACMVAVHSYRDIILEMEDQFDLSNYLSVVRNWLNYHNCPYLVGRALYTLSTFCPSKLYNHRTFEEVLTVTLQSLQAEKPLILRICAAQASHDVIRVHRNANNERRNLIQAKLLGFLEGVMALVPASSGSVTSLLLEALNVIIKFDSTFTANIQTKLIPMILAVFLKYPEDPVLVDIIQDLIKTVCQNGHCLLPLQEAFVPTIVDILLQQGHQAIGAKQDIALDVLATIVRCSKAPLPEIVVERAFPAMIHLTSRSDDLEIMVAGSECLRAFITVSPEQICQYKNGEGLAYIIEMTTMLLNPMVDEMTAGQVGRLVITIITKLGNMLGENVDLLLKAVVSKMQLADALKVIMNLVVVFAHLFLTQMEATLHFLSTVPGPNGEPAMEFVFSKWLAKQNCFFGTYELKVTTMALCKLFEYGVTTQDVRLTSINVQDLLIAERQSGSRIRTRSQTDANVWVTIPALVKIFKLLINEVYHLKEAKQADSETDTEDEDDHCTNDVGGDGDKTTSNLSPKTRLLNVNQYDDDEENDNDDELLEELLKNPLFQTDMEEYLAKYLQNFSSSEHFPMFASHLTVAEKNVLKSLEVKVA